MTAILERIEMKNYKFTKAALAISMFFACSIAQANSISSETLGSIHYKVGRDIVTRDVTLRMDRLDNNQTKFELKSGEWLIDSEDAFMKDIRGADIAYIGFKDAWGMDGSSVHLLFKGVKLQGDNGLIYQGTLYKTTPEQLAISGETFEDCMKSIRDTGKIDDDWQIAGTFSFKK
jgi:hypothetical protein